MKWQARRGTVRYGEMWLVMAGVARTGVVGYGAEHCGMAGMEKGGMK